MNISDVLNCHKENRNRFRELSELCCNNVIVPFVGAGMSMPPYLGWGDTLRELLGTDDEKNLTKLNKILSKKIIRRQRISYTKHYTQVFLKKDFVSITKNTKGNILKELNYYRRYLIKQPYLQLIMTIVLTRHIVMQK